MMKNPDNCSIRLIGGAHKNATRYILNLRRFAVNIRIDIEITLFLMLIILYFPI